MASTPGEKLIRATSTPVEGAAPSDTQGTHTESEDDLTAHIKAEPTNSPENDVDHMWQITDVRSKREVPTEDETLCTLYVNPQVFSYWQDIATSWDLKSDSEVAWLLIQHFDGTAVHEKPKSYCAVCQSCLTLHCQTCDSLNPEPIASSDHGNKALLDEDCNLDQTEPNIPSKGTGVVTAPDENASQAANAGQSRIVQPGAEVQVTQQSALPQCQITGSPRLPVPVVMQPPRPVLIAFRPRTASKSSATGLIPVPVQTSGPVPVTLRPAGSTNSSYPGLLSGLVTSGVQKFPTGTVTVSGSSPSFVPYTVNPAVCGAQVSTPPSGLTSNSIQLFSNGTTTLLSSHTSVLSQQTGSSETQTSEASSTETSTPARRAAKRKKSSVSAGTRQTPIPIEPATDPSASVGVAKLVPLPINPGSHAGPRGRAKSQPVVLLLPGQTPATLPQLPALRRNPRIKDHLCGRCGASFKSGIQCRRHMETHNHSPDKQVEKPWERNHCTVKTNFGV